MFQLIPKPAGHTVYPPRATRDEYIQSSTLSHLSVGSKLLLATCGRPIFKQQLRNIRERRCGPQRDARSACMECRSVSSCAWPQTGRENAAAVAHNLWHLRTGCVKGRCQFVQSCVCVAIGDVDESRLFKFGVCDGPVTAWGWLSRPRLPPGF